jgi:DGQHR domain-containing protein
MPIEEVDDVLRFEMSLVTQGNHKFFSLTLPSDVLADTCFVTRRDEDPKQGFQRLLDQNRAKQIAEYIDNGLGTIPNSIVLSAQPEAGLQVVRRGKAIQFKRTKKAFLILDGQHRVFGFSLAKATLRIPVIIYNNLSRRDETRLFIDINTKQRPVSNELLLDIKNLAEYESDEEQLMRDIFDLFSSDPDSPLLGQLSPADRVKGKITRVTFNSSMKPLLKLFSSYDGVEIYKIVSAYLKAFIDGANNINANGIITNPTTFRAILSLFSDVVRRVQDRYGKAYTVDNFADVLNPIFSRTAVSSLKRPGDSYKSLYTTLSKAMQTDFKV